MSQLAVRDVRKAFGGLTALDGVSFAVDAGSITGLIGPNGSGKSTLFNVVTGFYRPDGGEVRFLDSRLTGLEPWAIVQRGLVRTFQLARVIPDLSVLDNVLLGAAGGAGLRGALLARGAEARREAREADRAREHLDLLGLTGKLGDRAGDLSYGQQKLVELARVLMAGPKLILLDEPMAGVNPTLAKAIVGYIERLNARGIGFLIVEHDMPVIMGLARRIVVLDQGRTIAEGTPADVARDARVVDAYLGR